MEYKALEEALSAGETVERCSIDQDRNDFEWSPVTIIDKSWDVSRYRIPDKTLSGLMK